MKLTLLQTAVRSINDLRIVETLDEFQSTTYGHGFTTSLSYETYYDQLINACVRYDKTKKANIGKRRNVYNTNIDDTYVDHPTACIDHVPNSPYGGIDLPPDEFTTFPLGTHLLQGLVILPDLPLGHNLIILGLTSQLEGMMVLSFCLLKSISYAMKALKAYITEAINRFHQRKVHNTEIVETPQNDPPGPPAPENDHPDLPESDLDIPDEPNLDFVSR